MVSLRDLVIITETYRNLSTDGVGYLYEIISYCLSLATTFCIVFVVLVDNLGENKTSSIQNVMCSFSPLA